MYSNIKIREILSRLDTETADNIRHRWPEIGYANYEAREIFRRMDVKTLTKLYAKGLETNYACIAVLAAEALIEYDRNYYRDRYYKEVNTSIIQSVIIKKLQEAFNKHQILQGSNLTNTLGFTLLDKCYEYDYLLAKYGYELSRGLVFMGPEDWFKESLKNSRRIPSVAYRTPWANAILNG